MLWDHFLAYGTHVTSEGVNDLGYFPVVQVPILQQTASKLRYTNR